MKKYVMMTIAIILILNTGHQVVNAQKRPVDAPLPGQGIFNLPSLTDAQKEQLKAQRMAHLQELQPLRNEMRELKARYRTLSEASDPDLRAINRNIDEQTGLMNKMMKINASHQQSVRKILTDEQRLILDTRKKNLNLLRDQRIPATRPAPGRGNAPGRELVF